MKKNYGWIIAVLGMFLMSIGFGFVAIYGVFFPSLAKTYGFTQSQLSLLIAFLTLGMVVGSAIVGKLQKKMGGRILILACGIIEAIAIALLGRFGELSILYGLSFCIGIMAMGSAGLTIPTILASWFQEKRGAAMGITMAGLGVSNLVYTPYLIKVINSQGYHVALLHLGIILASYSVISFLVIRNTPEEKGLKAYGLNPDDSKNVSTNSDATSAALNISLKEALKSSRFWYFFMFVITTGMITSGIFMHMPTYLIKVGFTPARLGASLSAFGLFSIFGKMAVGVVYDKFSIKVSNLLLCGLALVTFMSLKFLPGMHNLIFIYIALAGGALAFATIANPILTGNLFGLESYSDIYSVVMMGVTGSAIVASIFSGIIIDKLGFDVLFNVGIVLVVLTAILSQAFLTTAAKREKYSKVVGES